MLSMHTAGTAGAAASGTPRGAAARSRCGEPDLLRISCIFWKSGRPHAPGGPMQGPPCRAARERGARCVTDIWYFEMPGGHAHPGAPRPPGPPGSGEPGVLPTSACTPGDQFDISRAGGSDSSPPRPDLGGSGPGPKDPKPQMHTPILTCKSCRADAGSPVMMAHGYSVFETTACPAKSRREPGAAGAPGRGSLGRDHKIQDARLDLVI